MGKSRSAPASLDDWVRWALSAELPEGHKSIGRHAVGRVLVGLAVHANAAGLAWPAAQTLADDISGMSRRDVRNALEVLVEAGLIEDAGKVGRALKWRLLPSEAADDLAGYPAGSEADEVAGNVAGHVAGEVAGQVAGYPATNRTELNGTPPYPLPDKSTGRAPRPKAGGEENKMIQELASQGISADEAQAVINHAKADPETLAWRGRLKQPGYLAKCREAVKAERRAQFEAGAKCEDHPEEVAANCRSCAADIKVGYRDPRYRGKTQPLCADCGDPLIGYDEGAVKCRGCNVSVVKSA